MFRLEECCKLLGCLTAVQQDELVMRSERVFSVKIAPAVHTKTVRDSGDQRGPL